MKTLVIALLIAMSIGIYAQDKGTTIEAGYATLVGNDDQLAMVQTTNEFINIENKIVLYGSIEDVVEVAPLVYFDAYLSASHSLVVPEYRITSMLGMFVRAGFFTIGCSAWQKLDTITNQCALTSVRTYIKLHF